MTGLSIVDILPMALRQGIPHLTVRVSCFVGGCHARHHVVCLVLHRLHRHIAFRKPCGSFSVSCSSVTWFSSPAKERERANWLNTLLFLRKEVGWAAGEVLIAQPFSIGLPPNRAS
jgi:hypothetical protein